jgi:hypothetical protein
MVPYKMWDHVIFPLPHASSSGKKEIAASTIVYFIRCAGGDDAGSCRRDGFFDWTAGFSTNNCAFYISWIEFQQCTVLSWRRECCIISVFIRLAETSINFTLPDSVKCELALDPWKASRRGHHSSPVSMCLPSACIQKRRCLYSIAGQRECHHHMPRSPAPRSAPSSHASR